MVKNQSILTALSNKRHKVIAALFLITAHLPEHDALRREIRRCAVQLSISMWQPQEDDAMTQSLMILLEAALLARMVSESNVRIVQSELAALAHPLSAAEEAIAALFPREDDKGRMFEKKTLNSHLSFSKKNLGNTYPSSNDKKERQEKILSFINIRKSVNVKDIATLFPEVSEKTIQRELGALVVSGKITKRGDKRWSIYLAV